MTATPKPAAVKLGGRFYCERCGRRVMGGRPKSGQKRIALYVSHGFIPPRSLLARRCKCGSRWAEEGTGAR